MTDDPEPEPDEWEVAKPRESLDRPDDGAYHVHLVDVGEGQGTLVDTGDEVLLYDAGPEDKNGARTGPRGERAVLDALDELDVDRVDHVVASHLDGDHVGGLGAVLESDEVEVGNVHMPDVVDQDIEPKFSKQVERFLEAAAENGHDIDMLSADTEAAIDETEGERDPTAGDAAFTVGEMDVHVLNPADWPGAGRDGGENNETHGATANEGSAVLYLEHEAGDGVLTGDVEGVSAQQVAERYDISDAVWTQAPHHAGIWGGGYVMNEAEPDGVVIPGRSAAEWTWGGGHPHVQRLVDIAAQGVDHVLSSAANGWSVLEVDDGELSAETARADPMSARDLIERFKGESLRENLSNNFEYAVSIPVQAMERQAGGRLGDMFDDDRRFGSAEAIDDGLTRFRQIVADPVVDAIDRYADTGDEQGLVEDVADAVRPVHEGLAETIDAVAATDDRILDRIERRDRRNEATREAFRKLPDETVDRLAELRDAVEAEREADPEDRASPETLDAYLYHADEKILEHEAVDKEEISVEGLLDLHDAAEAEGELRIVDHDHDTENEAEDDRAASDEQEPTI